MLVSCEKDIIRRSQAVDVRWSSDKCQQSGLGNFDHGPMRVKRNDVMTLLGSGTIVPAMLSSLEAFDKRKYNEFEQIDNLYDQIFQSDCKEFEEVC